MPLYLDNTPRAKNIDQLWKEIATPQRYASYRGKSLSMIDHYYDKLLMLGNFETRNLYLDKVRKERIFDIVEVALVFGSKGKIDDDFILDYCRDLLP